MSRIPTPSNGQVITYPPCQPWCFYPPEDHDPDDGDYCHLPIGRGITGLTRDGDQYELSALLVYARLPHGAPDAQNADANMHHRNVVQIAVCPLDKALPAVTADIQPGNARSFAAALIHGAELAEGIAHNERPDRLPPSPGP
ncbi:MAG TPA: hypothetical protein VGP04_13160 [Pseudonocardiaceae bacterium]|jgi:hypothetical protein|nr:hypothetical protein [Pseudonocardiaceae bacterium]